MPTLKFENVFSISQEIIAAGLDGSRWPLVLEGIRKIVDGANIHFLGYDTTLVRSFSGGSVGYDPSYEASFDAYYGTINSWMPTFAAAPVGKVLGANDMFPEADLLRTEFYNDWVRPQEDIRGGGGAMLLNSGTRFFAIGANIRHKTRENQESKWLALLNLLVPSLQQALEISRAIAGVRLSEFLMRQGVDPDGTAVAVLSSDRRLAWANELGLAMAESGMPFRIDARGRLKMTDPHDDNAVTAQLDFPRLAQPFVRRVAGGRILRAVSLHEECLSLLPFPFGTPLTLPAHILILTPEAVGSIAGNDLRRRYGLSESELAVVRALVEGLSPAEIAASRGASIHTVRNQIRSAMARCDCQRVTQLIVLAARTPP